MKPNELIKAEFLKKLRLAHPTFTADSLESLAERLAESGAYSFNGERLIPCGDRGAVARAFQIDPAFVGLISAEHVRASSANSSPEGAAFDRVNAKLASMGLGSFEEAMAGDSETGREFYGIDLATLNTPKGAA